LATLNIFSAGAAQAVVTQIAEKFQRESGDPVNAVYGAVGAMKARIVAGEPADVIVLTAALIDELIQQGWVVPGSRIDLGKVGTGVAVRAGTPLPDSVLESIRKNKVAIKSPITTPVGTGFRSVNVALRKEFDLYANVRPIRSIIPFRSYDRDLSPERFEIFNGVISVF